MPKVQKSRTSAAEKMGTKRKTAPKASKATKTARKQPSKSRTRESNATDGSRQSISSAENPGTEPRKSIQKSFTFLTARTRRIPQATVASEWQALHGPAQQRVKDLLTTAKRTVVSGTQSQKRSEEAETVVGALMGKLVKRLPRMPFPPNTKELNFDLEKLLERSRLLEARLTASLHSYGLMEAELEKEQDLLDHDLKQLNQLKAGAKQESRLWKQQGKATHLLLRVPSGDDVLSDGPDSIGLVSEVIDIGSIFDNADPDLAPILAQLTSHLESIQANSEQLDSIDDSMSRTRAALESVLQGMDAS